MKTRIEVLNELKSLETETQLNKIFIDQVSTEKVISLFIADYTDSLPLLDKVKTQIKYLIDACTLSIQSGGSVVYVGAGTSGRLGVLDASECPPTFGVDGNMFKGIIAGGDKALRQSIEGAEDEISKSFYDYYDNQIKPNDVVIGITASSRTPYVLEFLREHKKNNGKTALIVCNQRPVSEFQMVDILIAMNVGNELLTGSTRLKSGTMTKIILNMVSTITMINLGKVYKNYMVDLKPTNEKLKVRAIKTFIEITNESFETSEKWVEDSGFQLKTALVMYFKKLSKEEAELLIKERSGFLKYII